MFPLKAFSMSAMDIYQILKLNYYKKLKEWWTDDVDGDCTNFNLYRNTESSLILLKRWRGDFRKEEYWQSYQEFFLEESTQIEWSIKKIKTMEEPMKQILKLRNIISVTNFSSIHIQNLDLSEHLLIDYPNLKDFRLFIL